MKKEKYTEGYWQVSPYHSKKILAIAHIGGVKHTKLVCETRLPGDAILIAELWKQFQGDQKLRDRLNIISELEASVK